MLPDTITLDKYLSRYAHEEWFPCKVSIYSFLS